VTLDQREVGKSDRVVAGAWLEVSLPEQSHRGGELVASDEHDQAIWVSPEEAKSLVESPGEVEAIDRVARNVMPR